ncbi:MAG: SDR family NAD(P)-dependent oxidoreductase [Parvibaculum sp.]|nr:SDR family NAD(P)-dependent oxidoreductase [Parvibaculum sp.]
MGQANGRKSIFITGAASGMGLETARLFHSRGWFVGGYDVNGAGLTELEKELGGENCIVAKLDVTDKDAYGSDKLHWYVPPELVELDKATGNAAEMVRDQIATTGPIAPMLKMMEEQAKKA